MNLNAYFSNSSLKKKPQFELEENIEKLLLIFVFRATILYIIFSVGCAFSPSPLGGGGFGMMIQAHHIYYALFWYYYYISNTSDH